MRDGSSHEWTLLAADLLVLETASVFAGPSVGMCFAELGARVVKLENKRTGGDVTRKWKLPEEDPTSPVSAYFSSVNWGKEHRSVDLTSAEGQQELDTLLAKADVLITNHLEKDAVKLGLDRSRVQALNPSLVHGHIKGFAQQPDRPAFDVVLQAETGYISMTGNGPDQFAKIPIALVDVLAAHQLKEGILLALWQRERTGRGAYVEVSLEEAALAGLINQASNVLMADHDPRPMGTLHPNIAPYGEMFRCADGGAIILAVGSDSQFGALCAVLGLSSVPSDPRFQHNAERVRNRNALAELIGPCVQKRMRGELLGQLAEHDVPAGPVRSVREALATPVARAMRSESSIDEHTTTRLRGNVFTIVPY
ncbi:MAG: CoA transferase [Flavobacteriales bacterium]|nr:CoA transferase [Flavobacteriales bacterium]